MKETRLSRQVNLAARTIEMNTKDLSDVETMRPPPGGGNPLNWILGHVVYGRNRMLQIIGAPEVGGGVLEPLYGRGTAPPPSHRALPLAKLLALYRSTQEPLQRFLEQADEAAFERPIETPSEILGKTVGDALYALIWHEGYHAGQIGTLRRFAGKPGAIP